MEKLKLKILDLGYLTSKKTELMETDCDIKVKSPVSAVLIRHPQLGNNLYDTGNDDVWQCTYSEHIKEIYPVGKAVTITEALKKEGLQVNDIDILILSHMHFDHVGGLKFFQNTKAGKKVIVPEEDLMEALFQVFVKDKEHSGAYLKELFYDLDGITFHPVSENVSLAEDLTLFVQKGHTPGLLGMKVHLQDTGTVIFCGDTVYTEEAYRRELPPGGDINNDSREFLQNLKRLKQMQSEGHAVLFFGHDAKQCEEWIKKGWIE